MDFLFRLLALADVAGHCDVVCQLMMIVINRRDGHELRIDLAILAPVPDLSRPLAGVEQLRPHRLVESLIMPPGLQDARVFSKQLFRAIAGKTFEGLIDAQDVCIRVGNQDGFLCFERGGSDAQLLRRKILLSDVLHRPHRA